jgi:hypothetical protein
LGYCLLWEDFWTLKKKPTFSGCLFQGKGYALILTKYVLGYTLGDVFYKLIWSPWTKPLFTSQNRVETSWKKFAHLFQHACSTSWFHCSSVASAVAFPYRIFICPFIPSKFRILIFNRILK